MTFTKFAVLVLTTALIYNVAASNTSDSYYILNTVVEGVKTRIEIRYAELEEHLDDLLTSAIEKIENKKSDVHATINKQIKLAQSQGENVNVCYRKFMNIDSIAATAEEEVQHCQNSSMNRAKKIFNDTIDELANCKCDHKSCVSTFGKEITEIAFIALKNLKHELSTAFKCYDTVVEKLYRDLNDIRRGVKKCIDNIMGQAMIASGTK